MIRICLKAADYENLMFVLSYIHASHGCNMVAVRDHANAGERRVVAPLPNWAQ